MPLVLNKFYNLGTLSKSQVDENWDDIEEFSVPADTAEVREMSAERVMTPKGVGDALDWVSLSSEQLANPDGYDFVAAYHTLTGNAVLGNFVNFSKGTKYLIVQGNNSTQRTLTFGSNYKGDLPTLVDISDTRWYLLSLVAFASDHIIVSSVRAL